MTRADYAHLAGDVPVPNPTPSPDPSSPPRPPTWDQGDFADLDGDHGHWLATVTLVGGDDVLNARLGPGVDREIMGRIEPGTRLLATGYEVPVGTSTWAEIITPLGSLWVNARYLTPTNHPFDFRSDRRVDAILHGLSTTMRDRGDLAPLISRRGLYLSYNGVLRHYPPSRLAGLLKDQATEIWPVPAGRDPGPPRTFAVAVGDGFRSTFAHPDAEVIRNEWPRVEPLQPIPLELRDFDHVGIHGTGDDAGRLEAWFVSITYEAGEPLIIGLTHES